MPCNSQQVSRNSSLPGARGRLTPWLWQGPSDLKAVHKDFLSPLGEGDLAEPKLREEGRGMQEGL